ncbi:hypothetical protein DM860_002830 [Cuscuta australis]|uniref:C2H2-type domain-containing protein n=1 Tax=Cuscuta australis TaxID=267555 RepID=A0A328D0M7_9ASTE|nr:hypothetical protein DM860_002830 [Cuscuta australis]
MKEQSNWTPTTTTRRSDDKRKLDSWEDQQDPGGCVWPPRSYSCSFCGREFMSAQALGGHMNVHRRERARLKHQSSSRSPLSDDEEIGEKKRKKKSCLGDVVEESLVMMKAYNTNNLMMFGCIKKPAGNEKVCLVDRLLCHRVGRRHPLQQPDGIMEELDLELRLGNNHSPKELIVSLWRISLRIISWMFALTIDSMI